MKQKLKNAALLLFAGIGVLLIAFSVFGLITELQRLGTLGENPSEASQTSAAHNADQAIDNMQYGPGDLPDIDALLQKELQRILDETEFSYRDAAGDKQAYAGEHTVLFHNQTGISFAQLLLQVSLYQLDNPQQYATAADIPVPPVEVQNVFVGPLQAGDTVQLSFSTERDDYNYFVISYGYDLDEAA